MVVVVVVSSVPSQETFSQQLCWLGTEVTLPTQLLEQRESKMVSELTQKPENTKHRLNQHTQTKPTPDTDRQTARCTCLAQMVNHAVKCLESTCLTVRLNIRSDAVCSASRSAHTCMHFILHNSDTQQSTSS